MKNFSERTRQVIYHLEQEKFEGKIKEGKNDLIQYINDNCRYAQY